jgi:Suppressor of fused protein (SUFU)
MLLDQLTKRFEEPIQTIQVGNETICFIKLNGARGTVLCTLDLGEYQMPVPPNYESEASIELYFFLPEYWETSIENEVFYWAVNRLIAIKNYLKTNHWAISGNTFSMGEIPSGRLKEVGFAALLLLDPMAVEELKTPVQLGEKFRYFKVLTPVFKMEKDVKEARGLTKFIHRMMDKGVTEKLDEFREPVIKPRFLFWR